LWGSQGAALSLATADDEHLLFQCMQHQTPTDIENAESMIKPLEFRVVEVEGFRYRVDNAMRAVTNSNVKEARLRELKMEMLNSTKLKAHFEDNPRELDLLRHDKVCFFQFHLFFSEATYLIVK
jgi:ATP-dependent RNA helicase DDX56/DBP9